MDVGEGERTIKTISALFWGQHGFPGGGGGNVGVMPRTIQSPCKRLNPVHRRENPVNVPTAFLTIEMVFTTLMTRLVAYA
jgi:hypothetical protein